VALSPFVAVVGRARRYMSLPRISRRSFSARSSVTRGMGGFELSPSESPVALSAADRDGAIGRRRCPGIRWISLRRSVVAVKPGGEISGSLNGVGGTDGLGGCVEAANRVDRPAAGVVMLLVGGAKCRSMWSVRNSLRDLYGISARRCSDPHQPPRK
jgi:hypothetical protein